MFRIPGPSAPYNENQVVSHVCATGRCGQVTTQCQLSGRTKSWLWGGSCVEKKCNTPSGINLATVTPKTDPAPLSNTQLFTFTCDPKFVVVDQNSVTTTNTFMDFQCDTTTNSDVCSITSGGCCDVDITAPYSCVPMTCPQPSLPANAVFTPPLTQTRYSEDTVITVPCAYSPTAYCGEVTLTCSLEGNTPNWISEGECKKKIKICSSGPNDVVVVPIVVGGAVGASLVSIIVLSIFIHYYHI